MSFGANCECKGKVYAEDRPALALQESEASLFATYAADDVAFGAKNRGVEGKALLERVKNSMEKAGLPFKDFADRHTFELSGGEKRKLSVAGLIALDSSIMIFDEPTAGLDPQSRKIMLSTLQSLAREGKTVLFSTHRTEEADAADIHLDWQTLSKEADAVQKEAEGIKEKLSEMPPLKNASILSSLEKAGEALTAPPKIPDSPVSRLPASLKVGIFVLLAILAILPYPLWVSAIFLAICILYAVLAKYPAKRAFITIAKILPWFAFFALIQFAFFSDGSGSKELFRWKWFIVTQVKVENLLKTFIRAPSIILLISTFVWIKVLTAVKFASATYYGRIHDYSNSALSMFRTSSIVSSSRSVRLTSSSLGILSTFLAVSHPIDFRVSIIHISISSLNSSRSTSSSPSSMSRYTSMS